MSRTARFLVVGLSLASLAGRSWADDDLRRVLILGDTVYNQTSRTVASELKGRAKVVWKHPGDTGSALENLDVLLGEEPWDVVHLNFGLADLQYHDPRTKAVRAMSKHAGGIRVSSPEVYGRNLVTLVERLQGTGAKLVWASTTPIGSTQLDSIYDPGSEVEYNAIAAKVMAEHGVPVNDMHAFVRERTGDQKFRDPFTFGKDVPLHELVTERIRTTLGVPETAK